jgi:hypothetical protein
MSVLDQLQAIYNRHQALTPGIVLGEATDPSHPLHHRFTWDDSEAGHRWRLHQAQSLIRSVNVVIERGENSPPIAVRAFVSESEMGRGSMDEQPETGAYVPVHQVVADDVMRTAWFQALRRDWERLKSKAGASQEFAQMVMDDMRELAS